MFNKLQILTVQMKGVRLLAHLKESKKKKQNNKVPIVINVILNGFLFSSITGWLLNYKF